MATHNNPAFKNIFHLHRQGGEKACVAAVNESIASCPSCSPRAIPTEATAVGPLGSTVGATADASVGVATAAACSPHDVAQQQQPQQRRCECCAWVVRPRRADGETILHVGVREGWDPASVSLLLRAGARPNATRGDGWTPLHTAVLSANSRLVSLLLDAGASVTIRNACGLSAIDYINESTPPDIEALLRGAPRKQVPSLHLCARKGGETACLELLASFTASQLHDSDESIDIEERKVDGETPLHVAVTNKWHTMVRKLLEFGANPNSKRGSDDWTPLHIAASQDDVVMLETLLIAGSDPSIENKRGRTAATYIRESSEAQALLPLLSGAPWEVRNQSLILRPDFSHGSNVGDLALHVARVTSGVFAVPLMQLPFCAALTRALRGRVPASARLGLPFEGREVDSLMRWLLDPAQTQLYPLACHLYPDLVGGRPLSVVSVFVVCCYGDGDVENTHGGTPGGNQPRHTDDSDITLNVCIESQDLIGGELLFDDGVTANHQLGTCLFFPGTSNHTVFPVRSGRRTNVIAWLRVTKPGCFVSARPNLDSLPLPVLVYILSFITTPRELARLSMVCWALRTASIESELWEPFVKTEFPSIFSSVTGSANWHQVYLQCWEGISGFAAVIKGPIDYTPPVTRPGAIECKIVVLGDTGVGKSSFVIQFIQSHFIDFYDADIEDSYRKRVTIDGISGLLDILDTASWDDPESDFSAMRDQYLRTAGTLVLVFDITSRRSFVSLGRYLSRALHAHDDAPWLPGVLVGTKDDLSDHREVPAAMARQAAHAWGIPYFETSAKTRHNVDEAMLAAARCWMNGPPSHLRAATHASSGKGKRKHKGEQCSVM